MRLSPVQRHLQHHVAAQLAAAADAAAGDTRYASAYERQLMQLAEHRRALKAIQSVQRKIEYKREILPLYHPWIDGTLAADHGVQDEVLTTVLVWMIDIGNYERALQVAAYAIKHKLVLPDRYERTLGCVVAEEIADAQLNARAAGQTMDGGALFGARDIVAGEDMPDEVRAKLEKACGLAVYDRCAVAGSPSDTVKAELHFALALLQSAQSLHAKAGVKKDIERIERELKRLAAETGQSTEPAASGEPIAPRDQEAGEAK